jgi:hypothetical protein
MFFPKKILYIQSMDETPKPFKDLSLSAKFWVCVAYAIPAVFFLIILSSAIHHNPAGNPIIKAAALGKEKAVELYDAGKGKIKEFHKELHDSP